MAVPYHRGVTESAEEQLPEHVRANREAWDRFAHEFVERGRRNWGEEPPWGIDSSRISMGSLTIGALPGWCPHGSASW